MVTRLLLSLLLCLPIVAQLTSGVMVPLSGVGDNAPTLITEDDFEGSGWGDWFVADEDPEPDYATNPLEGSESARFDGAVSEQVYRNIGADYPSITVYFRLRFDVLPGASTYHEVWFAVEDSTTWRYALQVLPSGTIGVVHGYGIGGPATHTTDGLTAATDYYVRMHIAKGTGADGHYELAWAEITDPPNLPAIQTSGTKYVDGDDGVAVTDIGRIRLSSSNLAGTDPVMVIDDIRIYEGNVTL